MIIFYYDIILGLRFWVMKHPEDISKKRRKLKRKKMFNFNA